MGVARGVAVFVAFVVLASGCRKQFDRRDRLGWTPKRAPGSSSASSGGTTGGGGSSGGTPGRGGAPVCSPFNGDCGVSGGSCCANLNCVNDSYCCQGPARTTTPALQLRRPVLQRALRSGHTDQCCSGGGEECLSASDCCSGYACAGSGGTACCAGTDVLCSTAKDCCPGENCRDDLPRRYLPDPEGLLHPARHLPLSSQRRLLQRRHPGNCFYGTCCVSFGFACQKDEDCCGVPCTDGTCGS